MKKLLGILLLAAGAVAAPPKPPEPISTNILHKPHGGATDTKSNAPAAKNTPPSPREEALKAEHSRVIQEQGKLEATIATAEKKRRPHTAETQKLEALKKHRAAIESELQQLHRPAQKPDSVDPHSKKK